MKVTTKFCLTALFLIVSFICRADEMITVNFTKVTDFTTLTDGDEIIIVNEKDNVAMGPSNSKQTNRLVKSVVIEENKVTSMSTEVSIITIEDGVEGFYLKVADEYLTVGYKDSKYVLYCESTKELSAPQYGKEAVIDTDGNGNPRIIYTLKDDKKNTVKQYLSYNPGGAPSFSTNSYSSNSNSNIRIYRRSDIPEVDYDQDADMTDFLESQDSETEINVTLNRSFTADDGWYSLCLPFSLTRRQVERIFGDDVNVQEFDSAINSNDVLMINFTGVSGNLTAGTPYLIRPSQDAVNPTFKRVTITATTPTDIVKGEYKFIGIFSPWTPTANDKTIRFLSGSNGKQLDYPNETTGALKGTRAYFKIPVSAASSSANAITDDELGIDNLFLNDSILPNRNIIFTIDGKQINSSVEDIHQGIYIVNGKKMIVK